MFLASQSFLLQSAYATIRHFHSFSDPFVLSLQRETSIELESFTLQRAKVPSWSGSGGSEAQRETEAAQGEAEAAQAETEADDSALFLEVTLTVCLGSVSFKVLGVEGHLRYLYIRSIELRKKFVGSKRTQQVERLPNHTVCRSGTYPRGHQYFPSIIQPPPALLKIVLFFTFFIRRVHSTPKSTYSKVVPADVSPYGDPC